MIKILNKAIINLNILQENAFNIKNKLGKGVNFNAVVKADAYGHGASQIANALYTIVDSYSVALVDEAITLRRSGIDKDILVLIEPFQEEIYEAIKYDLILTVSHIEILKKISWISHKLNKKTKIHIKINTGMNRQGVDSLNELSQLSEYILSHDSILLCGIYSHFYNPEENSSLKYQLDKFLLAYKLIKGYNINIISHISASGGFLKGIELDMVRIGILLYGYKPFRSSKVNVKPVMKVKSYVIENREIDKNSNLLYGNYKLDESKKVSLIRVGYADGLKREENKDIINNRCMDISAINYTDKKAVNILGNANITAKNNGTISYEILTSITKRAEKIYIN